MQNGISLTPWLLGYVVIILNGLFSNKLIIPWWRHQVKTFCVSLDLRECGNALVTNEFSSQRPVTWNFVVLFDLRLNKRSCKQSGHRWFDTSYCSLWRDCNGKILVDGLLMKLLSSGCRKTTHIKLPLVQVIPYCLVAPTIQNKPLLELMLTLIYGVTRPQLVW